MHSSFLTLVVLLRGVFIALDAATFGIHKLALIMQRHINRVRFASADTGSASGLNPTDRAGLGQHDLTD